MIQATSDLTHPVAVTPARVVAVCVSRGSIPKRTLSAVQVTATGLRGDGHAHAKHNRPERAVSLFDLETLTQLQLEGFPLYPGAIGENLTVAGLHVQRLPPGTLLEIGEVLLRLEEPRKPCYVLDAISPCLKDVIVGRCGYMASVLEGGMIRPNMEIIVASEGHSRVGPAGLIQP
jgi:MOSC domain-containing protein YiiM